MTQEFRCQHCREPFGVTKEMFGSTVACPHCQKPNKLNPTSKSHQSPPKSSPEPPGSPKSPSGRGTPERKEIPAEVSNDLIPPKRSKDKKPATDRPATPPQFNPTPPPVGKDEQGQSPPAKANPTEPPLPPGSSPDRDPPAFKVKSKSKKSKSKKIELAPVVDTVEKTDSDKSVETPSKVEDGNGAVPALSREEVIKTLLPPKFLVGGRAARRSASTGMVLVPDSEGGYREVEDTVARVTHGGREIQLRTYTKQELSRRRQIFQIAVFVFCLLVLLFVFYLLNFFG